MVSEDTLERPGQDPEREKAISMTILPPGGKTLSRFGA